MYQRFIFFILSFACRFCAFALPWLLVAISRASAQNLPGYVVLPLSSVANSNQATVRVTLNGQRTMMALDTGASGTVVDRAFYRGTPTKPAVIKPDELPPEFRNVHPNGESADVGRIESLQAGGTNFPTGPVAVMDLSAQFGRYNAAHVGFSTAGLLGEDFLRRYAAVIDWKRHGVYLNTNPAKRIKLGPALLAAGWSAIPMASTNGRHFTVDCTISDKPVQLIVDTGAQFTFFKDGVVPLDVVHNRSNGGSIGHIASTGFSMRMIGMEATAYPARLEHWKIGRYEVGKTTVGVGPFPPGFTSLRSASSSAPLLGLLGAEVLARNNAIVDVGGSTLYLKHD